MYLGPPEPMPVPSAVVWTDVDLVAEARAALAEGCARLEVRAEGNLDGVEQADAVIAGSRIRGDAALFARAPRLQVIARTGIGFDRIDVPAATVAGVCVVHTPDAPTESTAEFAITLMLAVARRLAPGAAGLSAGRWGQGPAIIGSDLAGKTLGLVGCGRIGRRVAAIASALLMDVQAHDPLAPALPTGVRRAADLHGLLATSDVVSLHLPATRETRHLIGAAALTEFKPGALLINTARGPLVDEAALLTALDRGRLGGVGIDVWDPEPPAPDNPLLRHPLVLATPHMAASTSEGRLRSHLAAVRQARQVLCGDRPPFLLNPEVWSLRRRPAR